ncbi:hypothetical protein [Variovorax boronicumulans]|nr:hypothetical protein [Variovorax boronicumulans]
MGVISQDTVIEHLESHLGALDDLVRGAWGDVCALPSSCQVAMSPRSRASLVHDFMLVRAARYAECTPKVRYFERQLMHGLVFDGRYAVRFKKFDEDNRSKNQPTQQVTEFRAQVELEGIDAAHHLEVGYIADVLGTDILDVRLACPSGRGNAWVISISDNGVGTVLADLFPQGGGDGGGDGQDIEPAEIAPRKPDGQVIPFERKQE